MTHSGENLSDRLKLARAALSLNQKEFASKSGVGFSSYQKYEMGLSIPGGDAIRGFVQLGINANWLITGDGEMLLADDRPRLTKYEVAKLSKKIVGEAPALYALNPSAEFEARLKRVATMTDVSTRIYSELSFMPSSDWIGLIQTLLFDQHIDEAGAKQIVELLKRQSGKN